MIIDSQTNFLYLADSLPKKFSKFYNEFEALLSKNSINFQTLPNTKDIWCRDYMPVQIDENKFIQFQYKPDYLIKHKSHIKTISNVDSICDNINLHSIKSNLIIDGGNIVKHNNKVVMCDKVFKENEHINPALLIKDLENILEVDKIIFIPTDRNDEIGHADGMIRFYNDDTVFINNYSTDEKELELKLKLALHNANLKYIEIPYNLSKNKTYLQANGIYINYLQMQDFIMLPTFNLNEDEIAFKQFKELFPASNIVTIDSNDIANEGGVLNCITWTIYKD